VHGDAGFVPRTRNYRTTYHQRQRLLANNKALPAGPIDIRAEPVLLAEYLATPGKRVDEYIANLSDEAAAQLTLAARRVVGPYRAALAAKKLHFLLGQRDLPGPRTLLLKLPKAAIPVKQALKAMLKELHDRVCLVAPWKAKLARASTDIVLGRTQKVAEVMLNDKAAARQFRESAVLALDPLAYRLLADGGGVQMNQRNWDVPVAYQTAEVTDLLRNALVKWCRHFRLPVFKWEIAALVREKHRLVQGMCEKTARKHALHPDSRAQVHDPFPSHPDLKDFVMSRVDKNEHTLSASPTIGYWVALYELYLKDTQTFSRTGMSPREAARTLQEAYDQDYPKRFHRANVVFDEECLPIGTARVKQKCFSSEGKQCTKVGHVCLRTVVDTSRLPGRTTDKVFVRAWTVVAMGDRVCAKELWRLTDLRKVFFASRTALHRIAQFRDVCAKCDLEKPPYANLRADVGAMFNWAKMEEVLAEGPKMCERAKRNLRAHTVMIQHGRDFLGTMGGFTAGNYRRDTVDFAEMHQFMVYDNKVRLLVLGGDTLDPVVLSQDRGTFIGGRFSRAKTVIFLGRRAWRYLHDKEATQRDKFAVPGYSLENLIAIVTYVDDASLASFAFCRHCLYKFAVRMWGSDMQVTEEEWGEPSEAYEMRFLDSVETYDVNSHTWTLKPHDRNQSPLTVGTQQIPLARFAGPQFSGDPVRYARGLLLGRFARIHQLVEVDDEQPVVLDLGRILKELLTLGYSSRTLRVALSTMRQAWAMPAVQILTKMLAVVG